MLTQDLGIATAYGYAKSKGYTGTEEEFAELMASYADVAEQAEESAEQAEASAGASAASATQAGESAQTATTKAGEASASATEASGYASSASASAQTATTKAGEASASAGTASTKAGEASASAETATEKASEASTSATNAGNAATSAGTSATNAGNSALDSEAWAVGKRGGVDVGSSDPTYENNAKYYAEQAEETLHEYARIDGYYEDLTAGNAEQLVTGIRANDQTPYLFRTAGGSVDIGDREYINGIVGGTVAFNQLTENGNFENTSGWDEVVTGTTLSTTNNVITATNPTGAAFFGFRTNDTNGRCTSGHIYVLSIDAKASESVTVYKPYYNDANFVQLAWGSTVKTIGTDWETLATIAKCLTSGSINLGIRKANGNLGNEASLYGRNAQIIDLTQMFGSTIADYIYSLEQATAGAGVAFFKTLFPKPYYAYNAGELKSVKGLVSHDMVGFNAWDEEWEVGGLNASNGALWNTTDRIRSKNYIPILPNTSYYIHYPASGLSMNYCFYDANQAFISEGNTVNSAITTPTNAHYMKFATYAQYGTTYKSDICINLSWDGSEDGNYEPYQKWSYPLDSDLELRGMPKIENGNLYYDGDVYEADGTVTRKYVKVDLGALTFSRAETGGSGNYFFFRQLSGNDDLKKAKFNGGAIDTRHINVGASVSWTSCPDRGMLIANSTSYPVLYIRDDAYTDEASFKTAMNGVYLVYELATPTTETADPYTNPQIVNDFGTEEFVISNTVDVPIPVGHNTDYPINLKAKVEMAPNSPDGDGDYIVRQTNGTNEYVSIANNATIQNILARLEALEGGN